MIRGHLNPGGLYYFNTTDSNEAIATALSVYPYGLRIINFLAVSDTPIVFDKQRWFSALLDFRIDGEKLIRPRESGECRHFSGLQRLRGHSITPPHD